MEADWAVCESPNAMFEVLQRKYIDRKIRLFGCACCRRVRGLLPDARSRRAIEVAEQFADGLASSSEVKAAYDAASKACKKHSTYDRGTDQSHCYGTSACREIVRLGTVEWLENVWEDTADLALSKGAKWHSELRTVSNYIRDIFRHPLSPAPLIEPAWRTETVRGIAETIYTDRTFGNLPVLADALQDAGCENEEILTHLRGPGPHVRGCWALDLILGKS